MGVSLSQFVDYMIKGTSFAEGQYYSTGTVEKDFSQDEITRIQDVWAGLQTYSLIACISSAVFHLTITAFAFALVNPIVGTVALVEGIAFTIFLFIRYAVAFWEKCSWGTVKPGQDVETRLKCMKWLSCPSATYYGCKQILQETSDSLKQDLMQLRVSK